MRRKKGRKREGKRGWEREEEEEDRLSDIPRGHPGV